MKKFGMYFLIDFRFQKQKKELYKLKILELKIF